MNSTHLRTSRGGRMELHVQLFNGHTTRLSAPILYRRSSNSRTRTINPFRRRTRIVSSLIGCETHSSTSPRIADSTRRAGVPPQMNADMKMLLSGTTFATAYAVRACLPQSSPERRTRSSRLPLPVHGCEKRSHGSAGLPGVCAFRPGLPPVSDSAHAQSRSLGRRRQSGNVNGKPTVSFLARRCLSSALFAARSTFGAIGNRYGKACRAPLLNSQSANPAH